MKLNVIPNLIFQNKKRPMIRTVSMGLFILLSSCQTKDHNSTQVNLINHQETKGSPKLQPEQFDEVIDSILSQSLAGLKHYYKTDNIHILANKNQRSIEEQEALYHKGRSKTRISLHNLGKAIDILIVIDGKTMHANSPASTIPYQIVGHFVLQAGLFWGWDKDSGHIALTETVSDFIHYYPEQATQDSSIIGFYRILQQELQDSGSIETKYQPFVQAFEQATGFTNIESWNYRNDDQQREKRTLLPGINPYQ